MKVKGLHFVFSSPMIYLQNPLMKYVIFHLLENPGFTFGCTENKPRRVSNLLPYLNFLGRTPISSPKCCHPACGTVLMHSFTMAQWSEMPDTGCVWLVGIKSVGLYCSVSLAQFEASEQSFPAPLFLKSH